MTNNLASYWTMTMIESIDHGESIALYANPQNARVIEAPPPRFTRARACVGILARVSIRSVARRGATDSDTKVEARVGRI